MTVLSRDLRYPPDWPKRTAQEKGIDVALAIDFVMTVARSEADGSHGVRMLPARLAWS